MTELRRYLVAKMQVAALGSSMTEKAMQERRNELLRQLHDELPHLNRLRSSTLSWELSTESDGLKVLVFLDETPQLPLLISGPRDINSDLFRQDVKRILTDQRTLPERYFHALQTDRNPAHDEQIQPLRRHIGRRRKGLVHVHSSIDGEQLDLTPASKVLPQSTAASMTAVIDSLTRRACDVTLLSPLTSRHDNSEIKSTSGRLTLSLHPGYQEQTQFMTLAAALHERRRLDMAVSVTYRWTDGGPARYWLEELCPSGEATASHVRAQASKSSSS